MHKPFAGDFAGKAYRYVGTPYKKLDCQGLIESMLKDVGVTKNWKGSNAMYRDMAWTGTPEDCRKMFGDIPIGALLFILEQDGNEPREYKRDGIGNASHVGVKTGKGKGAVHASSSKGCVAESKFNNKTIPNGGWNRVGLCRLVNYGQEIEARLYGDVITDDRPAEHTQAWDDSQAPDEESEEVTIAMTTATVRTSGGKLNIREAPLRTARDIGDIPNGASVQVIEKTSADWWRVCYEGTTGYCAADYLSEIKMVSVCLTLDTAEALYRALSGVLVD